MTATPSSSEVTSTVDDTAAPLDSSPDRREELDERPQEAFQPTTPPGTPPPLEDNPGIRIRMQGPRSTNDIVITKPVSTLSRMTNRRNSIEISISIDFGPENKEAQGVAPV